MKIIFDRWGSGAHSECEVMVGTEAQHIKDCFKLQFKTPYNREEMLMHLKRVVGSIYEIQKDAWHAFTILT